MYLAMAALGIILVITGRLMPNKINTEDYSITEKVEDSSSDIPSSLDVFSLELLEKQAELTNKRIDMVNEKLSELEDLLKINIIHTSNDTGSNPEPVNINSVLLENNITSSKEDEHSSTNDINSVIYKMYDNGASLDEISSTLRIGRGELQLRLGLRKPQR